MKKSFIISALLLLCGAVYAQEHMVLHVGGGLTSLYGRSTKNIGTFCVGLGYEHEFDQKWSITASALYFAKGWKEHDEIVPILDDNKQPVYTEKGDQLFGKKSVRSYGNYLQIPVMMNYYIRLASPHYVSLSAGPYVAYGMWGKTETYGDTDKECSKRYYYDKNTFGDAGMHRFDAGLSVKIGYEYNRQISIGAHADLGLLKVDPRGGKNRTLYLSLMYRLFE